MANPAGQVPAEHLEIVTDGKSGLPQDAVFMVRYAPKI